MCFLMIRSFLLIRMSGHNTVFEAVAGRGIPSRSRAVFLRCVTGSVRQRHSGWSGRKKKKMESPPEACGRAIRSASAGSSRPCDRSHNRPPRRWTPSFSCSDNCNRRRFRSHPGPDPGFRQPPVRLNSHGVVVGEHRSGSSRPPEQRHGDLIAGTPDVLHVDRDAGPLPQEFRDFRIHLPLEKRIARLMQLQDAAVSVRREKLQRLAGSGPGRVDGVVVLFKRPRNGDGEHDRQPGLDRLLPEGFARLGAPHQQPVDVLRLDERHVFAVVHETLVVEDQQQPEVAVFDAGLNAADQPGQVAVLEDVHVHPGMRRHEKPDDSGAMGEDPARIRVRHIVQLLGAGKDALADLGRNRPRLLPVVQYARDGADRHAGQLRNIADCTLLRNHGSMPSFMVKLGGNLFPAIILYQTFLEMSTAEQKKIEK